MGMVQLLHRVIDLDLCSSSSSNNSASANHKMSESAMAVDNDADLNSTHNFDGIIPPISRDSINNTDQQTATNDNASDTPKDAEMRDEMESDSKTNAPASDQVRNQSRIKPEYSEFPGASNGIDDHLQHHSERSIHPKVESKLPINRSSKSDSASSCESAQSRTALMATVELKKTPIRDVFSYEVLNPAPLRTCPYGIIAPGCLNSMAQCDLKTCASKTNAEHMFLEIAQYAVKSGTVTVPECFQSSYVPDLAIELMSGFLSLYKDYKRSVDGKWWSPKGMCLRMVAGLCPLPCNFRDLEWIKLLYAENIRTERLPMYLIKLMEAKMEELAPYSSVAERHYHSDIKIKKMAPHLSPADIELQMPKLEKVCYEQFLLDCNSREM